MHPNPTKRCPRCGETKPLEDFYRDRSSRDGRYSRCKTCFLPEARERMREYANRPGVRERANARSRARYRTDGAHRERLAEQNRKWVLANWEKRLAVSRAWMRRNREKVNAQTQRQRARRRASEGSYSTAEWDALRAQYQHRCLACGEQRLLTPDHIVPISKGGTSYIENIQPLCLSCNHRKSTQTIDYRT